MEQFDVFLCHNSKDKTTVEKIAKKLEQRGLKPWLDKDQMQGGDSTYSTITEALYKSKSVVFFIGSSGSEKWQGNLELPIIVELVIQSKVRLIPVLLPGIREVPQDDHNYSFIRTKVWIDFNERNAQEKLYKSIRGKVEPPKDLDVENPKPLPPNLTPERRKFLKWVGLGTVSLITPVVVTEIWKGVQLNKLRRLLAANDWEEADNETQEVMIQAIGKKDKKTPYTKYELLNFPCTELHRIDQLWIYYSDDKFGFSVQKKIYESIGGQSDGKNDEGTWEKFGDLVGWRVNSSWIDKKNVTFDIRYSPPGNLPISNIGGETSEYLRFLFSRIETCKL